MSLPFSASAAGLGTHPGLLATHFQQRLPGRCLLLSGALLPGWGRDRKSAVAAQVLPCRLRGERASLLNAATWAAREEGFGGALAWGRGLGLPLDSSCPFSTPWVREGRRGGVGAPAGGYGNGFADAARCYFCSACVVRLDLPLPESETSVRSWRKNKRGSWNPQVTSNQ